MTLLEILLDRRSERFNNESLVTDLYDLITEGSARNLKTLDVRDNSDLDDRRVRVAVLSRALVMSSSSLTNENKENLEQIFNSLVKKLIVENKIKLHVANVPDKIGRAYWSGGHHQQIENSPDGSLKTKAASLIIKGANIQVSNWSNIRNLHSFPDEKLEECRNVNTNEEIDDIFRPIIRAYYPIDGFTNAVFDQKTKTFPQKLDPESGLRTIDNNEIITRSRNHVGVTNIISQKRCLYLLPLSVIFGYYLSGSMGAMERRDKRRYNTDRDSGLEDSYDYRNWFDSKEPYIRWKGIEFAGGSFGFACLLNLVKYCYPMDHKSYLAQDGTIHDSITRAVKGELTKHFVTSLGLNSIKCNGEIQEYQNASGKKVKRLSIALVPGSSFDDTKAGGLIFSEILFDPMSMNVTEILISDNSFFTRINTDNFLKNCYGMSEFDVLIFSILSYRSNLSENEKKSNQLPRIAYLNGNKITDITIEDRLKILSIMSQYDEYVEILKLRNIERANSFFDKATKSDNLLRMVLFPDKKPPNISTMGHIIADVYYQLKQEDCGIERWIDTIIEHRGKKDLQKIKSIIGSFYGKVEKESFEEAIENVKEARKNQYAPQPGVVGRLLNLSNFNEKRIDSKKRSNKCNKPIELDRDITEKDQQIEIQEEMYQKIFNSNKEERQILLNSLLNENIISDDKLKSSLIEMILDQSQKTTYPSKSVIHNDGAGLKCGYYAIAAGILQLNYEQRKRIIDRVTENQGLALDLTFDSIEKNQKKLGNAIFKYVEDNKDRILKSPLQSFVSSMENEYRNQKALGSMPSSSNKHFFREDDLKQQIDSINKSMNANIDIFADRMCLICQDLGINLLINGSKYGYEEIERAPIIKIVNEGGVHYEAEKINSRNLSPPADIIGNVQREDSRESLTVQNPIPRRPDIEAPPEPPEIAPPPLPNTVIETEDMSVFNTKISLQLQR